MPLIATWNVNSIKARLDAVLDWLKTADPDIVCLQEIKCQTDAFPALAFHELGYSATVLGQKSYNGVAILSKSAPDDIREGLPGDASDAQARYLEASFDGIRVASIYLPNGNGGAEKFAYKLAWMDRLHSHAARLLEGDMPLVLAGDYNVIPEPEDARNPEAWKDDALFQPESRGRFRALTYLGLTDAIRVFHQGGGHYSFWDYQGGAFQRDHGIRIDHLMLSPQAADRLVEARIDAEPRAQPKASDHTPVLCRLEP